MLRKQFVIFFSQFLKFTNEAMFFMIGTSTFQEYSLHYYKIKQYIVA